MALEPGVGLSITESRVLLPAAAYSSLANHLQLARHLRRVYAGMPLLLLPEDHHLQVL